jgi:hypothetical protein
MRKRNFWSLILLTMGLTAGFAVASAQAQTEGSKTGTTKKAATHAGHPLGKAEDISGTISSVDSSASMVTITSNRTPYVFRLTKKTNIEINGSKSDLEALTKQVNQSVSVHFVPRSDGNLAEIIEVKSS